MTINLGAVQINQLTADRQSLWTMPTFEGYPQYNLSGAVTGTPLPRNGYGQPASQGVTPASYPNYATTPYPVTPAYTAPGAPAATNSTSANPGPLPLYG